MANEVFQVRDYFNADNISQLAQRISDHYSAFDKKAFIKACVCPLKEQTYTERKNNITDQLENFLPSDFKEATDILINVLPPPYIDDDLVDAMQRFLVCSLTQYISRNGLNEPHVSLNALYIMTKCFTAEWDIRDFLIHHREFTLKTLKKWTKDKNLHVRRLVSEGSRPYVPWGKKLKFVEENPETTLSLLHIMRNDPSEYVRKSIANHLNDLSKKHADLVVKTLNEWTTEFPNKNMTRLANQALRTLIKNGHKGALKLMGFDSNVNVEVHKFNLTRNVPKDKEFLFSFDLKSATPNEQNIIVDYAIHFLKKNGLQVPKVFKLTKLVLQPNKTITIGKKFSFRPITTRVYYQGPHSCEILINGQSHIKEAFNYGS